MGIGSIGHWAVLALVGVLLFGGGRVSSLMGDVAKGIKSFKKGLTDDDAVGQTAMQPQTVEVPAARITHSA